MTTYKEDYKAFIDGLANTPTSAQEVGLLIARLAQYFSDAVARRSTNERAYNIKLNSFETTPGDDGKMLSSTKAEHQAQATEEHARFMDAKGDVESIEQMINALKSLQRGLLNEYSHQGNT